ncbi:MAG: DUF1499 domain-containing protein [Betaproteobacteria bacterium]|nr:DUF1499 domain-containing protein [Betaproteobacteria bacterium]
MRAVRSLALLALLMASAAATASPFGSLFAGERPATVGTGTLAPCPATPNCVASRATDDEHKVAPIAFRGDPAAAMRRLAEAAASLPGARVATSRPDYLHVEVASRFWGFVDDLEVVPDASGVLHVRSAARLGRSDLGVNRARVEALRAAMAGG